MDTITITLVKQGNVLVGRSVSDRWNLETLGVSALTYDRNQSAVKRLRRLAKPLGLLIHLDGGLGIQAEPTGDEREAFRVPSHILSIGGDWFAPIVYELSIPA